MIFTKQDINKLFTIQENGEEQNSYRIVEDNNNVYVEIEKDKGVLEFYSLGHLYDQNSQEIQIYAIHYIDIENKLYGRYKLEEKKIESVTSKENYSFNTFSDHMEIVNSYRHYR